MQLYSVQLDSIVRSARGKKLYPLVVETGATRLEARTVDDVAIPESSPLERRISPTVPETCLRENITVQAQLRGSWKISRDQDAPRLASSIFENLKTMPTIPHVPIPRRPHETLPRQGVLRATRAKRRGHFSRRNCAATQPNRLRTCGPTHTDPSSALGSPLGGSLVPPLVGVSSVIWGAVGEAGVPPMSKARGRPPRQQPMTPLDEGFKLIESASRPVGKSGVTQLITGSLLDV